MSEELADSLERVARKFRPLAESFFRNDGGEKAFFLSQLQLLDSEPGSEDQMWHVDNAARGISIILALDTIEATLGPTELLVGSQDLHTRDGKFEWASALAYTCFSHERAILRAFMPSNAALIFDSRCIHRGGGNTHGSKHRPVLVLRYDLYKRQPPGQGAVMTAVLRALGCLMAFGANDAPSCQHDSTNERLDF